MNWQSVIGLEVHVQLATQSKLFSSSPLSFGGEANIHANEVDMAMPGSLPVVNSAVVGYAVRFGLAVGADIDRQSVFARKHYFYPDLPKAYQISQYNRPIVSRGSLSIQLADKTRKIGITRAHLEEDAGKSLHDHTPAMSAIDLNRAGTPLLEIVSDPVIYSPDEAIAYLKAIHRLVRYLEISDGDMSQGSMRCDANISLRPVGNSELGTRVEIKNLNSFRFVHKALQYEIQRQSSLLETKGEVIQETRLYDSDRDATRSMRSKEEARDYRYFPDPDLPVLRLTEEQIEGERNGLPELPTARLQRYSKLAIAEATAETLVEERACAEYFDQLLAVGCQPVMAANWMIGEVAAALNQAGIDYASCPISAKNLAELLKILDAGVINGATAKRVFSELWQNPVMDIAAYIQQHQLAQVSDSGEIAILVDEVIAAHQPQLEKYRAASEDKQKKLIGFFVGKVMQVSKGKANPGLVNKLLTKKLK